MRVYKARDYGVETGKFCERELEAFLEAVAKDGEETVIEFEKGDYLIDSQNLKQRLMYITNTVGDGQCDNWETPHLSRTPLYFEGFKNTSVEGNGSRFILYGKATNAVITGCENFTLKDIEITVDKPHLHELTAVGRGIDYVDYKIDRDSDYFIKNNTLYFTGKDYRHSSRTFTAGEDWWDGFVPADNSQRLYRSRRKLPGVWKYKEIAPHTVRAYGLSGSRVSLGDRFYLFTTRRRYVGIFIEKSRNVALEGVKQRLSYSLALVAQDTENITADGIEFAPDKASGKLMSSIADFIHICMCRGQITIKNSRFDGSGDDLINVHGIHFKIVGKDKNRITVRFMHHQTHGFNPLHKGDEIAFINPLTMLETGRTTIDASEIISETDILLTLRDTASAPKGFVIEDISACPDLLFSGNTAERVSTRGLLITTRGKAVVENNNFVSFSMNGVLLSDDASKWYESGMCCDVTIRNNVFGYCGGHGVMIKSENIIHKGAVHKNIKIIGNTFEKCEKSCFYIKSASDVVIEDNKISDAPKLITVKNSENIKTDF